MGGGPSLPAAPSLAKRFLDPIVFWLLKDAARCVVFASLGVWLGVTGWVLFSPALLAVALASLSVVRSIVSLAWWFYRGRLLRERWGPITTEVGPGGIVRREQTVEVRYRWVPGQVFTESDAEVIMDTHRGLLWHPRSAFASPEEAGRFLDTARGFHAEALKAQRDSPGHDEAA